MENIDAHVLSKCAAKLDIGSFLQFRQSFKEARAASEDPFLWACASGCHGSETAEDTLNFIACSTKKIQILELQRPLFAPSEDPSVLLNAFRETRSAEVVLRESHARFERGLRYNDAHPYTQGCYAMRLARMLPKLHVLVIDEQTSCLGGLTDGMAAAFSLHCPELRRLEVRFAKGPVIGLPAERFTDDGLIAFAKGCPHLQVLSLCNCAAITDRSMCAVAAHCRQLQEVHFKGFSERLGDWGLGNLLASVSSALVKLCLSGKMVKATDAFLESAQRFVHHVGSPDQHTQAMAHTGSTIHDLHCQPPQGRTMASHISQYQDLLQGYPCEQTSRTDVIVGMPRLQSLKLSCSSTNSSLQALTARSDSKHEAYLFPSLQDLDLCKSEGITAGGVEALLQANRCPELMRLSLSSAVAEALPDEMLIEGHVRIHLCKHSLKCKKKNSKTEVIIRHV